MNAMSGVSAGNFKAFAKRFDFSNYKTLCDVGGATGQLSCMVAAANPHVSCISFDLPKVVSIATRKIEQVGLADRVAAVGGDFFVDPLPKADVITMGMILHDWNLRISFARSEAAVSMLPSLGKTSFWSSALERRSFLAECVDPEPGFFPSVDGTFGDLCPAVDEAGDFGDIDAAFEAWHLAHQKTRVSYRTRVHKSALATWMWSCLQLR